MGGGWVGGVGGCKGASGRLDGCIFSARVYVCVVLIVMLTPVLTLILTLESSKMVAWTDGWFGCMDRGQEQ